MGGVVVVEKRESIHCEFVVNGRYLIFTLTVPEHQDMTELKNLIIDNIKEFEKHLSGAYDWCSSFEFLRRKIKY